MADEKKKTGVSQSDSVTTDQSVVTPVEQVEYVTKLEYLDLKERFEKLLNVVESLNTFVRKNVKEIQFAPAREKPYIDRIPHVSELQK